MDILFLVVAIVAGMAAWAAGTVAMNVFAESCCFALRAAWDGVRGWFR